MNDTPDHHIVLLGDSIFDNAPYVPPDRHVTRHLEDALNGAANVTLCAVDGHTSQEIPGQLRGIPDDATDLFLSVGGNDALLWQDQLMSADSPYDVLHLLRKAQKEFAKSYERAIRAALRTRLPLTVCTIYKHIPGLEDVLQAPLAVFNDVITQAVHRHGLGLIDLRMICTDRKDYSPVSPIEPSDQGGRKIAEAIVEAWRGREE